ncbi:hypothetical protein RCC89_19705 [Cytophagaceae bacterium ABcell3]|nr:hypothetical protein RCC89_19705 [Cytophagaceae bacterium ABcell3]
MNIQQEILNNINNRYILLKKGDIYSIIDKIRRTMVVIDDPIIDKSELIKAMLDLKVEIYDDPKKLPLATEKPVSDFKFPDTIKVFIKKIYDQNTKETGSIISAITQSMVNYEQKREIESLLEHYAFTVLYPGEGLNLYSDINSDTVSIVVIKGINYLPYKDIDGQETNLFNW